MFLKVVIYQNVAFTHSNTQKDINRGKTKTCHLSGYGPLKCRPIECFDRSGCHVMIGYFYVYLSIFRYSSQRLGPNDRSSVVSFGDHS